MIVQIFHFNNGEVEMDMLVNIRNMGIFDGDMMVILENWPYIVFLMNGHLFHW